MTISIFTHIITLCFYFRALRTCIPKFLKDEFDYIENSFAQHQYPKSFKQHDKIKAYKIHKCKCSPKIGNNNFSNNNTFHRYMILPNISTTNITKV